MDRVIIAVLFGALTSGLISLIAFLAAARTESRKAKLQREHLSLLAASQQERAEMLKGLKEEELKAELFAERFRTVLMMTRLHERDEERERERALVEKLARILASHLENLEKLDSEPDSQAIRLLQDSTTDAKKTPSPEAAR